MKKKRATPKQAAANAALEAILKRRRDPPPRLHGASYSAHMDQLKLVFCTGIEVKIPKALLAGDLGLQKKNSLRTLTVFPNGTAIRWPALNQMYSVSQLLHHAFSV